MCVTAKLCAVVQKWNYEGDLLSIREWEVGHFRLSEKFVTNARETVIYQYT